MHSTFVDWKPNMLKNLTVTRPKAAYGRQGLDWIVPPGYSFVVFSTNRGIQLTTFDPKNVTSLIGGSN